jgi:hypothetical protein
MNPAWIIGNGPSLAITPLDKLVGVSNPVAAFATNRIHLIFNKTIWRPTHYVRAENPYCTEAILVQDLREIFKLGIHSYLHRGFELVWRMNMAYEHPHSCVDFLPDSCHHTLMQFDDPAVPDKWHEPMCMFGGSLFTAMQIAVKEGYGPLILDGCDLGYKDGQPSHFDPLYERGYEEKLMPADMANYNCLHAHMNAAASCPVPIYNATIGGTLEVYPRISFDDAVKGNYEAPISAEVQEPQPQPDHAIRTAADEPACSRTGNRNATPRPKSTRKKRSPVHG